MSFAAYSVLVFVASLLIAVWLKERALYVLFIVTYTQNLALAYLYTNGLAGRDLCRSLILFKEFLLLELFVYSVVMLSRRFPGRWPRPILILFAFTGYCVLRFSFGALFLNDFTADGLRKVRMMCYPAQIVTVAMSLSWLHQGFEKQFIRRMTYLLGVLALVGILLFLIPGPDFWKEHADIASFNIDVKGDDPSSVIEEQGISGTGAGREAFMFLSAFRAMGTFADPLAFGFAMAMPIVLLGFYFQRTWTNILIMALSSLAIFFTFSRSSWLFVIITFAYLWIRKRKYALFFGLTAGVLLAVLMWPPLSEFAAVEYSALSLTNPGGEHAEGIVWFYQRAFSDLGNILGKGMDDGVQKIPESGYAFLLEHFGFAAYGSFIWFCCSLLSYLRRGQGRASPLLQIAEAVPVCVLIVMHTSQYPFAFSEYLFIWFVIGACISLAFKMHGLSHEVRHVPA